MDLFACARLKCRLTVSACAKRHALAESRAETYATCRGCPIGRRHALGAGLIDPEPRRPQLSEVESVAERRAYVLRVMLWGADLRPQAIRKQVLAEGYTRVSRALIVKDLKALVRVGFVQYRDSEGENGGRYSIRSTVRDLLSGDPPRLVRLRQPDLISVPTVAVGQHSAASPHRSRVRKCKTRQMDWSVIIIYN